MIRLRCRMNAQAVLPPKISPLLAGSQGAWHQYMAPPEPWSQTIPGIMILSLIATVTNGLIIAFIQPYAGYTYFQARWPSSRN